MSVQIGVTRWATTLVGIGCALLIASVALAQQDRDAVSNATPDESDEAVSVGDGAGEASSDPGEPSPEGVAAHTGIEEIVVNARKRPGNLQETPIAISVFDMTQLDTANIQDIEGLSFSIPNFNYSEVLGAANITIRGIGTSGGDQATAFHIDGIFQNNPYTASGISFYDLRSIEVLRGPQGTLWGRNSTAGSINVQTNPPSFDFEALGDAQVGSYHEIRLRGVLNVPIIDDVLATRFSAVFNRRYGYTKNLANDVRSGDLDDDRSYAIRGQLRFTPVEQIDWVVRATYVNNRSNGLSTKIDGDYPALVPLIPGNQIDIYVNAPQPNPPDPREIYLDTQPEGRRDFLMVNTRLAWSLDDLPAIGDATLTLLGGWQKSDQFGLGDVDLSNAFSLGLPNGPNAGPHEMIELSIGGESSEWVAEANFTVDTPLPWDWLGLDWLIGGFYFGTRSDLLLTSDTAFQLTVLQGGPTPGPVLMTGSSWADPKGSDTSAAVFGNLHFKLWDQLTIFGGLRYSWDWKESSLVTSGLDLNLPDGQLPINPCVSAPIDAEDDASWQRLTGQVGAEWQFTEENMIYSSFSVGYKPGGIGLEITAPACTTLDVGNSLPEDLFAWEVGSKNRFWNDNIQLNLTGFAYAYENAQVTTLRETNLVTFNADKARILGAEVELVALPFAEVELPYFSIDTFLTTFNFGYTHSEFTDYDRGCLVEEPATCGTLDWTGNQLPRAPYYTLTFTAQYEQTLGRYGSLTPFLRYFYSDQMYFRAANRPRDLQPGYSLLDVTVTWRDPSKRLSLEGFVRNALDDDIISAKLVSSSLIGAPTISSYLPPRTWGVRLGLAW